MARTEIFSCHVPGLEIWIEYNASNLRIQTASWTVPAGQTVRARVWDGGVLVVDQQLTGTSSSNISGNYRLVENPDGSISLPSNLVYLFGGEG